MVTPPIERALSVKAAMIVLLLILILRGGWLSDNVYRQRRPTTGDADSDGPHGSVGLSRALILGQVVMFYVLAIQLTLAVSVGLFKRRSPALILVRSACIL